MERVNWDNTLLDWTKLKSGSLNPDKTFLFYMVSVAMYCISFYFLFMKHLPSEYIIFIFIFCMNTIFPFIWIKDLLSIDSENLFAHRLVVYRNIGVVVALSLQFISLFFVLLKNENVRKMKILSINENNNRQKTENLNTNDEGTEKADRIIAIIFVTITTLIWGVIGVAFSDNNIIKTDSTDSPLFETIRWLLNQPYQFIHNFEIAWHNFMDRIHVSPLVKAFGMYCLTFIVTLFGLFVRIPNFKHPRQHNAIDRFNIVNMGHIFPAFFLRNLDKYRSFSVFILSLIVSLCFATIIMFALKMPNNIVIGSSFIGLAVFLGGFLGKRKELFPDAVSVKNLIFFFLSAIFAMVGTPVVLAGVQLLLELFSTTLNFNGRLLYSAIFIFTGLLFTMFGLGVYQKWVSNANGKSMQMFIVTLVTMAFSLFTAINTKYKVSLGIYELIKTIMQLLLVYVTPFALVVLALVQFIFSYRNYMKYKQFEKIKV